ncbi:hypothetical protein QBC34DRAFT_474725, partial [Podospora aff. communis PSN243]
MAEIKAAGAPAPAPAPAPVENQYVQQTPLWVVVVRGFQALFAFVILAMCGYLIHGKAMDANVFALVVGLMTWGVVAYALVSEKVSGARGLYNIWAILSLDLLMAIFWLSSMGANAAQRASFVHSVNIEYCWDDGSAVNSGHCVVSKRALERRAAVAGSVALAVMSAIAGLSALLMLLFVATLVFHGHTFRMYHQAKKPVPSDNATTEMTAQQAPAQAPPQVQPPAQPVYAGYPSQTQPQAYPAPQVYPAPSAYSSPTQPQGYTQSYPPSQTYPPTIPSPAPLAGSEPYNGYPNPNQAPHQPPYHSPHGTPAPGQPYYPP